MSEVKKDTKFTDGLFVKRARDGAPDFVKGSLSIKTDAFCEFLVGNTNDEGWVNIDILENKNGEGLHAELNDWKPTKKKEKAQGEKVASDEDIPF